MSATVLKLIRPIGGEAAAPTPAETPILRPGGDVHGVPARDAATDRRGPLRPGRLISGRARWRGGQLAAAFRLVDAVAVLGLTVVAIDVAAPDGLWRSPLAATAPYMAAAALLIACLAGVGGYGFAPREGLASHLLRIAGACGLAAALSTAAVLATGEASSATLSTLSIWFCAAFVGVNLLHIGWWISVWGLRRSGRLVPNIVVVGATENAERLIERALESREVAVLGVFDDRKGRAPDAVRGVPILGDTGDLMSHRIMPFVDRIVITVTAAAQTRVRDLVEKLHGLPNEITLFVDLGQVDAPTATLSRLADLPLTRMSGYRANDRRALLKRAQDLLIAIPAVVLLAPVMAAVALAVRLDSPGPILFRQRRHGFNNEEIVVLKFRSMQHARRDERAERQVCVDDERVTRVGRIIRAASLDELPQLFNVLRGEMSLVGPRPHCPTMKTGDVETVRLAADYAHRHRMKPGITGWAAIKGSRGPVETVEKVRRRVALDIDYIERQSFWLDLYIMLMTLPCLLGDRHAAR